MRRNTLWFYIYVTWEGILIFKNLFRLHVVELKATRKEGENIQTFIFAQRRKLRFEAGQYALWMIPRFIWGKPARLFTIAASPTEDTLQVSTRISSTDFKQKLSRLPIGSKVYLLGPIGRFTLGKDPPKAAVLVAGGIGATPMRALATFVHDARVPTRLTLIHSADGYYLYREEFEQKVPECHFVTKETFSKTLQDAAGRVSDDTPFYISGPPGFVGFVEDSLRKLGKKHIRKDGFLGY
jgi:ferredoxin-NADP reductase